MSPGGMQGENLLALQALVRGGIAARHLGRDQRTLPLYRKC
jgi:hypothetical protein